jgi:hypothetical protein
MSMSILIGGLFLLMGLLGVFYPAFFYKAEKLSPEQIARNKRILKRCGVALIVLGLADLLMTLFGR